MKYVFRNKKGYCIFKSFWYVGDHQFAWYESTNSKGEVKGFLCAVKAYKHAAS